MKRVTLRKEGENEDGKSTSVKKGNDKKREERRDEQHSREGRLMSCSFGTSDEEEMKKGRRMKEIHMVRIDR